MQVVPPDWKAIPAKVPGAPEPTENALEKSLTGRMIGEDCVNEVLGGGICVAQ